jgi:aspartate/methionine/tyrosine aminotransferase
MELLVNGPNSPKPSGFMIPIPQYPLYSATISEYSAQEVKLKNNKNKNLKINIKK